jgi:hypothetical protein
MPHVDRIAEPWGTRTPYGPGEPLARTCHPQTLRQVRWADARLKESATQALVS